MAEFRVAMISTCTNILLQGIEICVLTVEGYQIDTAILEPFSGSIFITPVMNLLVWQKALWRSRPVGDNKMNFSLCTNMTGVCTNNHMWCKFIICL